MVSLKCLTLDFDLLRLDPVGLQKEGSHAKPEEDCLNKDTGIYEKEIFLEFYDLYVDRYEEDALTLDEMSRTQWKGFRKLCRAINGVSSRAVYFQNSYDCRMDGSNLKDIDPVIDPI